MEKKKYKEREQLGKGKKKGRERGGRKECSKKERKREGGREKRENPSSPLNHS